MHHLVYLHGFLSSPQSLKAQNTLAFVKKHYPSVNVHIPQLSGDITKALATIERLLKTLPINRTGFIGSSMGGFLSTYSIEKYTHQSSPHCLPKAVLINPAVEPFNLLADVVGKHINPYTKEIFYIQQQHIVKLKQLYIENLQNPLRYQVLLQTGDETLDYKLAVTKYTSSDLIIEKGGDHSFVDYERHLAGIMQFLVAQ